MKESFLDIADALVNEGLLKTEEPFVSSRQAWVADFAGHFLDVCKTIQSLQAKLVMQSISYLEYTMLYANFLKRRFVAEARVYGEESYLDKSQHNIGSHDVSHVFEYFDKLWDKLLRTRKRFVGQVSSRDVLEYMTKVLPHFYSYLASVARSAIAGCVHDVRFTKINKNEQFWVNVGDYMEMT